MIASLTSSQPKYFLVTVFALALHLLQPCLAQANRYAIAVLPFTVTDPSGKTPESLGETLPNYFEAPIFNSQKFIFIDKSITDKIVADIASSEQGLTSEKIKQLGDTYEIDILIIGNITVEAQSPQPYVINARFIDTAIGEVRSVSLVRVGSDTEFQSAAQQIIDIALTRFPLQGQIYAVSGEDIYIDVGSIHGLLPQDQTGFIYRQVAVKDKIIQEQIGTFTVKTIYEDSSKIRAEMLIGYDAKEGDSVTVAAITTSTNTSKTAANAPSETSTPTEPETSTAIPDPATPTVPVTDTISVTNTVPATDAAAPETATESVATTGTLIVESDVEAEMYLDGTFMGLTPLTLELTPGDYTLELWAETYQTLAQSITITASEIFSVSETLEPLAATVTLSLTPPGTVVRVDGRVQLSRSFTLSAGDYILELRHNGYETKTLPLTLAPGEAKTITETLTATAETPATEATTLTNTASDLSASTDSGNAVVPKSASTTQGSPNPEMTTEAAETEASSAAILNLTVFPPDATVTIDAQPSQAGEVTLGPGIHTLAVTLEGYEPFTTDITLELGQTYPFDVTLGASRTEAGETSATATTSDPETISNPATISDTATTDTAATSELETGPDLTGLETNQDTLVTLSAKSCDDAATLKSGNFTTESEILFMNQSPDSVKTYWVNYGGGLEFYNILLPGQEVLQQTAPGHVWIVTDIDNECIAIFEPVADPAKAVLK